MLYLFFSLLCICTILSALSMLFVHNPITAVFFLLLVFFFSSLLFIFLNGDFIGLVILIVYVGAIAVLFLFIVMMLNLKRVKSNTLMYMYIFYILIFLFSTQIIYYVVWIYIYYAYNYNLVETTFSNYLYYTSINSFDITSKHTILRSIGLFLFMDNLFFVFLISILLMISIISSIYLTNFKSSFSIRSIDNTSRNDTVYLVYMY